MNPILTYESSDRAALEPGERLLWEGGSQRGGRPRFRITSRRAFCIDGNDGKKGEYHTGTIRWPFQQAIVIVLGRCGLATIQLGATLWITRVENWTDAAAQLVEVNRARRKRRRRGSVRHPETVPMNTSTTEISATLEYSSITTDLGLLDGERVLWSGQPVRHQPIRWPIVRQKLTTVAWLVVPAFLGWRGLQDNRMDAGDVIFGLIACGWFLIALHALTIKPLIARWRLLRTRYVLTTRRAFALEPHRAGRQVRFVFIDALPAGFSRTVQPDGSGDVGIGLGMTFQQIPDAATVHATLVNAVLAARKDLPDLGWQEASATL